MVAADNIIVIAKKLAECQARVAAYSRLNARGETAEEETRMGAISILANTALEKAQREYDEAVAQLSAEEVMAIVKIV